MSNPDPLGVDRGTAMETFIEFESDINRVAQLDVVKRLGGEPPILLTLADVAV